MDDLRSEQIDSFLLSENPSRVLSQLNEQEINRLFAKLRAHNQTLSQLARQDPLTELPNRFYFEMSMKRLLAQADRRHQQVAVLYMDLDGFKQANDLYGHHLGDQVLIEVASCIRELMREEDLIARLGGDEFVLVLPCIEHKADAGRVAQKLIDRISSISVNDYPDLNVSACIGIAIFPVAAEATTDLLQCADTALYAAKKRGSSYFEYYTNETNMEFQRYETLFQSLQKSVHQERLPLVYMPIMSLPELHTKGVMLRLPAMTELALSYWESQNNFYVNLMMVYIRQLSELLTRWHQHNSNKPHFYIVLEIMPSLLMHDAVRQSFIALLESQPWLASQLVLYLVEVPGKAIAHQVYTFCQQENIQYCASYLDSLPNQIHDFRTQLQPAIMTVNVNALLGHNLSEKKDLLFLKSYAQFMQSLDLPVLFTHIDTYGQKQLITQLGSGLVCGKVFATELTERELLHLA